MENKKLPIALVGYGAMGREIEKIAGDYGYDIKAVFDIDTSLAQSNNFDFEVAIDFSFPEAVLENVEILAKHEKNIVIGTTGWQDDRLEIEDIVKESGIGVVWGSNFSLGMQMLFRIAKYAGKLVNKIDGYDVMLHEMHHKRKKDSPSGSALTLAEILLEELDFKNKILTETAHEKISPKDLHVSSTRGGEVTGNHTIYIDSAAESIELSHRAKNRSGFAAGALTAAKWIHGKSGFYEFSDVLKDIWD